MAEKSIPVTAYFDPVLVGKLEAVAKADDRSLSYMIVQAVREMIGKQEHVVKWRQTDITDAIAQAVKRGPVTPLRAKRR
jgi:predicted transcriptional regulator